MTSTELETVSLEVRDTGVAVMTLKEITFTRKMIREIDSLLTKLEQTEGPMCLVTRSVHPKIFSAGLNLDIFRGDVFDVTNFLNEFSRIVGRVLELPFPSVALINGHLVAGGLMFVMAHDYRIMVDNNSKIMMNEIANGLGIPRNMGAAIFAKLRPSVLRDLNLIGLNVSPKQAKEFEIVDFLEPDLDSASKRAFELAEKLADVGEKRLAYRAIKVSLYKEHIEMTKGISEEDSVAALRNFQSKM